MLLKISFLFTFLFQVSLVLASQDPDQLRLMQLAPGTKLLIPVGNEELIKDKKLWVGDGDINEHIQCRIYIDSHFDVDYAQDLGHAVYEVEEIQITSENRQKNQYEEVYFKKMKNSDLKLPAIRMSCSATNPHTKDFIILKDIKNLLGQNFFDHIEVAKEKNHSIKELSPLYKEVVLLEELKFSAVESGSGISSKHPYFYEGKVLYKPSSVEEQRCRGNYRHYPFGSYDITLVPQTKIKVRVMTIDWFIYKNHRSSFYRIHSDIPGSNNSLSLECWGDNKISDFEGIFQFIQ